MAMPAVSSEQQYRLYIRQNERHLAASGLDEAMDLAVDLARSTTRRFDVIRVLATDISDFCRRLADSESRVAAVIVTPDEGDVRHKAFLREVRELTSAEGAWLIWHEPKTQTDVPREFYGIRPDVICWRS